MNAKRISALQCLALGVLLAVHATEANAFWWLLRGLMGERMIAGAVVRSSLTEMEAAAISRRLAARAQFCIRPVRATTCDFRNAASAKDAVQAAVGRHYQVRKTELPDVFKILDEMGNIADEIEVLDRNQYPEFEGLSAYFPPEENDYEVACSAGFAPSPNNPPPELFWKLVLLKWRYLLQRCSNMPA